jgi:hypothetical protein
VVKLDRHRERRKGREGARACGPVGLLGQLGEMGQMSIGPVKGKKKLEFNFELISRFRKID